MHFEVPKNRKTIKLHISSNGERFKISTGVSVDDPGKDFKIANIKLRLNSLLSDLAIQKKPLTKQLLLEVITGKIAVNKDSFIEVFDLFIRQRTPLLKLNTIKKYQTVRKLVSTFSPKLTFDEITPNWAERFSGWLLERGNNNNSIGKDLKVIKTFMKWSEGDYHNNVKYRKIKGVDKPGVNVNLSLEELNLLMDLPLEGERHLERNAFIVRCLTGLRFSDLEEVRRNPAMIQGDYIVKETVKVANRIVKIPLHPIAKKILLEGDYRVVSNQKANALIKLIAADAGIDTPVVLVNHYGKKRETVVYQKWELISTHTSRKTFACLSYDFGMTPEDIAEIMGIHISTLSRYLEVKNRKAVDKMKEAWGRL